MNTRGQNWMVTALHLIQMKSMQSRGCDERGAIEWDHKVGSQGRRVAWQAGGRWGAAEAWQPLRTSFFQNSGDSVGGQKRPGKGHEKTVVLKELRTAD